MGSDGKGLNFPDASFDLVLSSYVLHGLSSELRQSIYAEAGRLSRSQILFCDYNQKRWLLTDFIEWAEDGDYFGFIRQGEREMRNYFAEVHRVDVGPQSALYHCIVQ
nr:class I SAM-dependent methyltransferase [Desulfosporosinus orientis]